MYSRRIPLQTALDRGLDYLEKNQKKDGSFGLHFSNDPLMPDHLCRPDNPVFGTCLIAYSLRQIISPRASTMEHRARNFLSSSASGHGLWRFWPASDAKTYFLPFDSDDTACASLVLQKDAAFHTSRDILLANRDKQGLFYTWIFPRTSTLLNRAIWKLPFSEYPGFLRYLYVWQKTEAEPGDIDAAVNANVLACLGEGPHTLPVIQWLREILEQRKENDREKWYEPLMTHYMISRAIACGPESMRPLSDMLEQRILEEIESPQLGPLAPPIAAASLLNLNSKDRHLPGMITATLQTQGPDGSWPAAPAFRGGPKRLSFWGGRVLTTAFALEAIARYLDLQEPGEETT